MNTKVKFSFAEPPSSHIMPLYTLELSVEVWKSRDKADGRTVKFTRSYL